MLSKIDQQMLKQPHQDEIEEIRAQLQQVLQNHITMMALISNIRNNRTRRMESEQQKQQTEQAQQQEMITPPMKKRAIRNPKGKMSDEADESNKENMLVPTARGVNGKELAELPNNWLASTDDLLKMIGYSAIIGGIAELVGLPATLASLLT